MIGISGFLIWSKILIELIFNLCDEVRRAQLAKSTLLTSILVRFRSFKSVQMLKREREREKERERERESGVRKATGSYRTYSIPGKTAALVPEFTVEDLPSAELQLKFLCLQ